MSDTYYSNNTQNIDLLEASRIAIMNDELRPIIAKKLALSDGIKVLDVGCGTGEFTYYLGAVSHNVEYIGIDLDSTYIERARNRPSIDNRGNTYRFLEADATNLPFEDNEFDLVISQAFLTACFYYEDAFEEMKRVCKKGGIIGTLNPIDFFSIIEEKECNEFNRLSNIFENAYNRLSSMNYMFCGINPRHIPEFFTKHYMESVEVYPVGQFFSLDNSSVNDETKERYIKLMNNSELKKIDYVSRCRGYEEFISHRELEHYRTEVTENLKNGIINNDNKTFEYEAAQFLLVTGVNRQALRCRNCEKYKDNIPSDTIARIRKILDTRNIKTREMLYPSGTEGLYSCVIRIEGTDICQCGKGTTPQYALASGYAEFMERFQTGFMFNYKEPDKTVIEAEHIGKSGGILLEEALSSIYKLPQIFIDADSMIKQWVPVVGEHIAAYPFKCIDTGETFFLPDFIYRNFEYTNGSCAGNSREEALVQGICEIIERYAASQIISKALTPPKVPDALLDKYPLLKDTMNRIQRESGNELYAFDASLAEGFPVAGVCLINKKDKSIRLRFGCHPKFEIALERALTEMYQGATSSSSPYNYPIGYEFDESVASGNNLFHMLKFGRGAVSTAFIAGNESYGFSEFKSCGNTNSEMLDYLLEICRSNNWSVYVRDCSFFGFDTYHVVIPQISFILAYDRSSIVQAYSRIEFRDVFRKFAAATDEEQNNAIKAMSLFSGWTVHDSLDYMADIRFNAKLFGKSINYKILSGLKFIKEHKYSEAADIFKLYRNSNNKMWALYEMCMAASRDEKDSESFINNFCTAEELVAVKEVFNQPYSVLPKCAGDCELCSYNRLCDKFYLDYEVKL